MVSRSLMFFRPFGAPKRPKRIRLKGAALLLLAALIKVSQFNAADYWGWLFLGAVYLAASVCIIRSLRQKLRKPLFLYDHRA